MTRPAHLRVAVGLLALISISGWPTGSWAASRVSIGVPANASPGTTSAVTLRLPDGMAAVEGRVLMKDGAAELVGIAPTGRGTTLAPIEVAGGYAFAAYDMKPKGSSNDVRLVFVPLLGGRLELSIKIDAAADSSGRRVAISNRDLLSRVQVGRQASLHRAPAKAARSAPDRAAQSARDLFGRGIISPDDIDIARAAWYRHREMASSCALDADDGGDANADGCVDVVDLQALLADQGRSTRVPSEEQASSSTTTVDTRLTATVGGPPVPPSAAAQAAGTTFVVTSTADTPDAANGNGICADAAGQCTLRAALTESNWQPGQNRIEFNLVGSAPVTIQLGSSTLPTVGSSSSSVFIDGYSQPGSAPNSAEFGSNAVPGVEVRGNGNAATSYLFYSARAGNVFRGLLISNAYRGIFLDGPAAVGNVIVGNWLGFNRDNSLPPRGKAGVWLNNGAHDTVIGTPALADRNVIGNYDKGIYTYGAGTDRTIIQNNVLCIGPTGLGAACQTSVDTDFGPKASLIGGSAVREGNAIGPTKLNGIEFSHGWDPSLTSDTGGTLTYQINDHRVIGNWIGFRNDGSYDPAFRSAQNVPTYDNGQALNIHDGANNNLVEGNHIAAAYDGVTIAMSNCSGNIVRGNVIGESRLGEPAPLARWGIYFYSNTSRHVVEGNTIRNAGLGGVGLLDQNVRQIRISQNIITDTNGPAIYLQPDPVTPTTGANLLLAPPTFSSVTASQATGAGIPGATVEIYSASRPVGQAGLPYAYLASAVVAGDGTWSASVSLASGDRLTALQIAPDDNTSALAGNAIFLTPSSPLADFGWLQQPGGLRVDFSDISTGVPAAWSWDFGDGSASTLQHPSRTYAAAGDYTASLTVTNGAGTDTRIRQITVAPASAALFAADAFGRSVVGGWGSADVGGAYSLEGGSSSFGVANGVGTISLPAAGANRAATLNSVSAGDIDLRVRIKTDKTVVGSAYYAYLIARRNGANSYRPKLIMNANGTVSVHAGVVINNAESSLGPSVTVAGLSHTANGFIWLRAQISGTSPTTINVKAWADGQSEPAAWQFSATNSSAAVQVAGSVGLRAYIGSATSNAPVVFSFDDFAASGVP